MSILDDLKSLDPNDPGRWPLPARAATVALCFLVLSGVLFYFFVWSDQKPRLDQTFNAGGAINDAHDVKLGATNGSIFAYVADGKNGLRVIDAISANETPGAYGFSPRPTPKLVAT